MMPTNELVNEKDKYKDIEKDNKPLLDTSSPHRSDPHGVIVPSLEGVEHDRRGAGLSLSPLVISSLSPNSTLTLETGTVLPLPPRPDRSPERQRFAELAITQEIQNSGSKECDTQGLESVVASLVTRLEAVPPPSPDSRESSYSSEAEQLYTVPSHKRLRSLPSIAEMPEVDRSRSASGGTFGAGLGLGRGRGQRGSDETGVSEITIPDTQPVTPTLPTSGGGSPISPLILTNPPLPGIPSTMTQEDAHQMPAAPPTLHVTRPSTSSARPESGPDPFAAVVKMMNEGDSPGKRKARGESPLPPEVKEKSVEITSEGRAQIPRRGMMGPSHILAKVRSSSSLSKLKQLSKSSLKSPTSAVPSKNSSTSTRTPFLRPAPLPPPSSSFPARFAPTNYSRSNNTSPSPSYRNDPNFARAGPDVRKSPNRLGAEMLEGEEMVEIPRFKRKELNLGLVRKRGPGQRIAWVLLWLVWFINGLAGLFFDVNLMYMLVQCTSHSPNGDGSPSRSWAFASAAYAICWAISIFVVWLGWEVYFEFWRKWRQTRPAIEPILTSLPASLHLSLMSYSHFTFLVHVRLSSLSTPYRYDIIPEAAHALVQTLPGILPLLPRAGIGIVLLTTFASPTQSRGKKDDRFFSSDGGLNPYAQGVILAFVAVVGFRFLIFLISAIFLWLSSARPARAFFSRSTKAEAPTTPQKRARKSSHPPRDPATTRSPQKTWYEAETSYGWDTWRSRMRARLQDAYELCMIRRSGGGIGTMVDGSYLVVGGGGTPSPRFSTPIRMGSRSMNDNSQGQGSVEVLKESENGNAKAKALSEQEVDDWLGTSTTGSTLLRLAQARPGNPEPPSSQSQSSPSIVDPTTPQRQPVAMRTTSNLTVNGVYTTGSQASHSSHDIFYTPAQGNTPMTERTMSILGEATTPTQASLRPNPSHGTLPARPESDVMGNQELLSDPNDKRASQMSGVSDESITDDSAALISASPRRESQITSTTETGSGSPSRSNSTASQNHPSSRRSSVSRTMTAAVNRSRAGSASSVNHVLTRARSSSITLLREGAGAVQGVVRRARSGTVDGNAYAEIAGDSTPNTIPRRRSKLGLGPSLVSDRAVSS